MIASYQNMPFEIKLTALLLRWVAENEGLEDIVSLLKEGNIPWQKFNTIINLHEVYPFVFSCLNNIKNYIPQDFFNSLKKHYDFNAAFIFILWNEFKNLTKEFLKGNFDFIPIKGAAFILEDLYKNYEYQRPMADIDILIKKEDLPLFENRLISLGYVKDLHGLKENYWKTKSYHIGFVKKSPQGFPCILEVHWQMTFDQDKRELSNFWQRKLNVGFEDNHMNILSPEDTLITLALNQRHFGKTLCLKNALDLAMIFKKYSGSLDWDYLAKESKRGKLCSAIFYSLCQAGLMIDVRIPDEFFRSLELPKLRKKLIKNFVDKNSFVIQDIRENKICYLKSNFFLYDNILKSLNILFNAPKEKFAMFYRLKPYTFKTGLIYHFRFFYIIFKELCAVIFQSLISKIALNYKEKML